MNLSEWAEEDFCRLTTTGRHSRRKRTVELWFAIDGERVYFMSGGKAGWVYNIDAEPAVAVEVNGASRKGRAEIVNDPDEDRSARRLLAGKYQGWKPGGRLSSWARTAIPVVVRFPRRRRRSAGSATLA